MLPFPDRIVSMAGYEFYLDRAMRQGEQPDIHSGASGYFSTPQHVLDPHIFDGQEVSSGVRDHILGVLYAFLHNRLYDARSWSNVWLAGSGISYQWAADRGNGDLDVMLGIDFPEFYHLNPGFQGVSEAEVADMLNDDLKRSLWPHTANTVFNGQPYEVTYYFNPGVTAKSITAINPYAAYNLTANCWDIRPPMLPDDPSALYAAEWRDAVEAEERAAQMLVQRYSTLRATAATEPDNSPAWKNTMASQELVVTQAKALFDSIHLGRHNAFAAGGRGYGDYYNYRWQHHKRAGTVQALDAIATLAADARQAEETDLYGAPLDDAHTALEKAALWNTPYRRT